MNERSKRQSFLGETSDAVFTDLHVGLVGLGGGGSHVAQQLSHIGIGGYTLVDHDAIDESNLNRLVGGTATDVTKHRPKTTIAARQIRAAFPSARIKQIQTPWQQATAHLAGCDLIVGSLDGFGSRLELEAFARRHLIPYVDLGMDVYEMPAGFGIAGQVTVSLPGMPCLKCLGVIREEWRAEEAAKYGAAGGRPQVVWPNGVLASLAVGVVVQLFTPWRNGLAPSLLLEYDGNAQTIQQSSMLEYLPNECPHHAGNDSVGDPWFTLK